MNVLLPRGHRINRFAGIMFSLMAVLCLGAAAQTGRAWPEADQLFRSDPLWLGSDAAFSVDLGNGRVLWLFGDTFVAHRKGETRRDAAFVRNTVGIQTGYDPSKASMKFYWRTGKDGPQEMFTPTKEKDRDGWLWPQSGIRLGSSLLLFCSRIEPDLSKSSLGFKMAGWEAYRIDNPDDEPTAWRMKKIAVDKGKVALASAALRDGEFLYLFGSGDLGLYMARVSVSDAQQGQLKDLKWWSGRDWRSEKYRQLLVLEAGTESSLQKDPRGDGYLEVNSQGFGASDIVMRRANHPEGLWGDPVVVYRPPESDEPYAFVYAGKSHAELKGADMVLTYATNGPDARLAVDMSIYFPRFVRVDLPPLGPGGLLVRRPEQR